MREMLTMHKINKINRKDSQSNRTKICHRLSVDQSPIQTLLRNCLSHADYATSRAFVLFYSATYIKEGDVKNIGIVCNRLPFIFSFRTSLRSLKSIFTTKGTLSIAPPQDFLPSHPSPTYNLWCDIRLRRRFCPKH